MTNPDVPKTDPAPLLVLSPMQGTVVRICVDPGDDASESSDLVIIESMKMEHVVTAPTAGTVTAVLVVAGDQVNRDQALLSIAPTDNAMTGSAEKPKIDLDLIRPDLAEVIDRHRSGLDSERAEAVAKRHAKGQRTARENIQHLVDDGSFVEYAPLVIAAQRRRRAVEELIERTPADGLVGGLGHINGQLFAEDRSRCAVLSYDYMVLAGTQGQQNHRKKDRLFEIAERLELPVVFFTEGGGGRPGDTDGLGIAGLDCFAFAYWARLSGLVPMVGINSGFCFAGNAAILSMCDVIIATRDSNIGMAGPAMIEGGGLGVFEPTEIGPVEVQEVNGTIDIVVDDEAEAVEAAKRYLSYFQGRIDDWDCADQRLLRHVVPENRLRSYDVHDAIEVLADSGSVLELRAGWAKGMITCLARVEGRPVGIIANNNQHLSGAIDADGADKSARFMQLCDGFDIPILFLCDTPGFMVGPESEAEGMVRHAGRLFVTAASLTVPFFTIVTRKGYGLGAQAMAGGGFKMGLFTISWPTGEFGGMGLEGFVKLGYRRELEAAENDQAREQLYRKLVDKLYEEGKALSAASHFEIDEVIDPADSRSWIVATLKAAPPATPRSGKKRPMIDTY
ncbi:MAG: carboxyl transferase domain-containing protein [Acidimicrobiales bacterium]